MNQVIRFLRDLSENNNREWFQENKARYDESRKKALFLTEVVINEIRKFDPEMMDDKLKTAPKGFSPDHVFIDLLRYKSFAFMTPINQSEVLAGNFIGKLVESFKILHPVNRFLNEALENNL